MFVIGTPVVEDARAQMEDLAAVLGTVVLTKCRAGASDLNIELKDLGLASRIVATDKFATVVPNAEGAGAARVAVLQDLLSSATQEQEQRLRGRISNIQGSFGVIRINVTTESEYNHLREVVEDGYRAVQSALQHGVLPGGGKALYELTAPLALSRHLPWPMPWATKFPAIPIGKPLISAPEMWWTPLRPVFSTMPALLLPRCVTLPKKQHFFITQNISFSMETSCHASAVADVGDKILIMVPGTFLIKPSVAEKEVGGPVVPNTKEMRVGTLVKAGPSLPSVPFPEIPVGSKFTTSRRTHLRSTITEKPFGCILEGYSSGC